MAYNKRSFDRWYFDNHSKFPPKKKEQDISLPVKEVPYTVTVKNCDDEVLHVLPLFTNWPKEEGVFNLLLVLTQDADERPILSSFKEFKYLTFVKEDTKFDLVVMAISLNYHSADQVRWLVTGEVTL